MLKCNTLAKWVQQTIELKLMVPVSLSFFFFKHCFSKISSYTRTCDSYCIPVRWAALELTREEAGLQGSESSGARVVEAEVV